MTIHEMLLDAMEHVTYVSISRDDLDGVAPHEGYVLRVGQEWIELACVSDTVWFDGWMLIRRQDVTGVTGVTLELEAGFVTAALMARGEWPPPSSGLMSDIVQRTERDILRAFQHIPELVCLGLERHEPKSRYFGCVVNVSDEGVHMLEIEPDATWASVTTCFDPASITLISFGGDYEKALLLVGGLDRRVDE